MGRVTIQWIMAAIALFVVLALSSVSLIDTVQAQCSVRSDWGIYTVARGDTLYRIAQRFNTTTAMLVQGNCLPNANRIYSGQQLRVPSIPPGATRPPDGTTREFTTAATFQQYEYGFMVWRADNGEIRKYVGPLGGDAVSLGGLTVYSTRQYASLPSKTFITPPAGRVAPIMGFAKVWGNIPGVAQGLGWAISPEQSYTMTVTSRDGVVIGFSLVDGRLASHVQRDQWTVSGFIRPTQPPPPTPDSANCFAPPYIPSTGITVGSSVTIVNHIAIMSNPPPRGTPINELLIGDGAVVIGGPYCLASDNPVRAWRVRAFQAPNQVEGYVVEYTSIAGQVTTYLASLGSLTTQAAFQQYSQGFMIWRADTGTIYVFGLGLGTYPQSSYQGFPDNDCVANPPPAGSVCPINGFGRVWASDVNTRQYMGWATAQEQSYQATIEMRGGNVYTITLPDGRAVIIENGTTWRF